MSNKPKISVILTNEAREIFKDDDISIFIKDGSYFNCEFVEQNGSFLDMTVVTPKIKRLKNEGIVFKAVLSIPTCFVLYMLSGDARKHLGFSDG